MEIWSVGWSEAASARESVARCLSLDGASMTDVPKPVVNIIGGHDETVGAVHVHIASEADQQEALSHVGLVEWIVLSFEDWSMIPVENVVAAAQGSPTKVAAVVSSPQSIAGAAFALDTGVDAVAVSPTATLLDAAEAMRASRLERVEELADPATTQAHSALETSTVIEVASFGLGDRVCVDLAGLLAPGEGMLVGSTAGMMALIHGETVPSAFVPTRPFRVNAGAVHQYALLSDGSTCYLSELTPGDELLITDAEGNTRPLHVGRLKIERRPLISVLFSNQKGQEGRVLLQNAETVRVVDARGTPVSVTALETGMRLISRSDATGRHVGQPIESEVTEH
ncbi:MAG: 3-dehydroquinate synthase II [Candidatus Poseidoniaceae archaeon]